MRLAPATLILLLLLLSAPASAATVDASALRAHTTDGRWSLSFEDGAGRGVLAEAPGSGRGPTGRLGLQVA